MPTHKLASLSEDPPIVLALSMLSGAPLNVANQRREKTARLSGLYASDSGTFPPAFSTAPAPEVFIGFPDSSPSNDGSATLIRADGDPHGFNVAWITRYLTCPGGASCLSTPLTELAFDRDAAGNGAAQGHGAAYGERTTFAKAIYALVDRWKGKQDKSHLVINLSAGWEPDYECAPSLFEQTAMRTGQRAPRRRGNQIVAADGTVIGTIASAVTAAPAPSGTGTASPKGAAPTKGPNSKREGHGAAPTGSGGSGNPQGAGSARIPHGTPMLDVTLIGEGAVTVRNYPVADCGTSQAISPASQDVYDALRFASCQGALIIAATGNDPGYNPPREGPMLPAKWERYAAPDAETCRTVLGVEEPAVATGHPLVNAVSGVDDVDLPMIFSRRHSRSRLAASSALLIGFPTSKVDGYGDGDASCTTPPCTPSFPMTGTSMAAAVTSAAAAAVWARHQEMSASQVIDAVYATGEDLRFTAHFCLGGSSTLTSGAVDVCPAIHRVSICRAVSCAGSTDMAECLAHAPCAPRAAYPGPANSVPPWPPTTPPDDTGKLRTNLPFVAALNGVVTGQPVTPCPPCTAVLQSYSGGYPPYDLTDSIATSFWGDAGEYSLTNLQLGLYDRFNASISIMSTSGAFSTPSPTWTSSSPNVSGGFTAQSIPVSATLTWTGNTGHIYSQQLALQ